MADTKIRTRKVTAILREDHRKVKKLFSEFEKLEKGDEAEKSQIFETIKKELTVHAQIEEELFYPAIAQVDDEKSKEMVLEAAEEHKIVKTLLQEISSLTPEDDSFDAKVKVLMDNVKHHADEEEKELFPCFDEDVSKEERDRISEQLQTRKEELTSSIESGKGSEEESEEEESGGPSA